MERHEGVCGMKEREREGYGRMHQRQGKERKGKEGRDEKERTNRKFRERKD